MNKPYSTISVLNQCLTSKLTSINQFFLHARMTKNWGLKVLDGSFYQKSIHDMKDADTLIERTLLLGGLPNLQALGQLKIGESCEEILQANLSFLQSQHRTLVKAVADCEQQQDYVSRDLLVEILAHEEEHIDWTETQLSLIDTVGLANYLQSQMEEEK